jgi:hypothetical protein
VNNRWDLYFCELDGAVASFVLDLGLIDIAPVLNRPYVLRIRVRMIDPREDGLSSDGEAPALGEIESQLEATLAPHAIFAGRYTANSVRTFVFYCDDESRVDAVAPVFTELFPFHKHTAFVQEDPQWRTYLEFLYPDVLTLQSMINRALCEQLGELPEQPVELVHAIAPVIDSFLNEAVSRGFREVDRDGQVLRIARADRIGPETIDLVTHPLVKLAEEFGCEYRGWTRLGP